MLTGSVRAGLSADVFDRARGDGEPLLVETVVNGDVKGERETHLRVQHDAHLDAVVGSSATRPVSTAPEAVDRVVSFSFGERHLVVDAVEGVCAVLNSVGPGYQRQAACAGASPVLRITVRTPVRRRGIGVCRLPLRRRSACCFPWPIRTVHPRSQGASWVRSLVVIVCPSRSVRVEGIPLSPRSSHLTARIWLMPSRLAVNSSAEPAM